MCSTYITRQNTNFEHIFFALLVRIKQTRRGWKAANKCWMNGKFDEKLCANSRRRRRKKYFFAKLFVSAGEEKRQQNDCFKLIVVARYRVRAQEQQMLFGFPAICLWIIFMFVRALFWQSIFSARSFASLYSRPKKQTLPMHLFCKKKIDMCTRQLALVM